MERESGCERCGSEVDVYHYCDEDLCIDCIAREQLLVEDCLEYVMDPTLGGTNDPN